MAEENQLNLSCICVYRLHIKYVQSTAKPVTYFQFIHTFIFLPKGENKI